MLIRVIKCWHFTKPRVRYSSAAACIVLNTVESDQPSPVSPETVDSLLLSVDLESRLKES
ncbi:unnamed protein product [Arabidopsis thaliana]|uniref:Uncharacterized protein n=2 Tax=Arabidopsis thaliana TaxID=3702 RepID=B3H760_ARATH|nr:uncharacterized protein AT3G44006 [Arabidopsis thaliana]AEE77853.1 hypothetical protein AT3G44006 [Arabidopsis thaliana]VYS59262.1 unnamed protein product [Arabidopsis thaliana]|eukprot:NP_001319678.1 hypothetical protein AT3G44006 [Arabidopsis thaliana]